jgi:hypothetical protein
MILIYLWNDTFWTTFQMLWKSHIHLRKNQGLQIYHHNSSLIPPPCFLVEVVLEDHQSLYTYITNVYCILVVNEHDRKNTGNTLIRSISFVFIKYCQRDWWSSMTTSTRKHGGGMKLELWWYIWSPWFFRRWN